MMRDASGGLVSQLKWRLFQYFPSILPSTPFSTDSTVAAYIPKRISAEYEFPLRGLRCAVRIWPSALEQAPDSTSNASSKVKTLLLLHGWMDVAASFQFLVDALPPNYRCVSFDWRGFGSSQHTNADSYWFADYVADLDQFIDHAQSAGWIEKKEKINLVAHSMGGNVAMLYAGIRPERIGRLINLEGTGLPSSKPGKSAARYRQWLDEIKSPPSLRPYANFGEVAARLQKTNSRLRSDFAQFLAQYWAEPVVKNEPNGPWKLNSDPTHKISNPLLYRVEEILACWREITAPTLLALASDTNEWHQFIKQQAYQRRLIAVRDLTVVTVPETGHMMHHDQPVVLADLIHRFVESGNLNA